MEKTIEKGADSQAIFDRIMEKLDELDGLIATRWKKVKPASMSAVETAFADYSSTFEAVMAKLDKLAGGPQLLDGDDSSVVKGGFKPLSTRPSYGISSAISALPRVDLPSFDGSDPLAWLVQAEQSFMVHNIATDQRVQLAITFMTGNVLFWGRCVFRPTASMTWAQFSEKLVERFGDSFEEKPVPHDESSNEGETLPPPSPLPVVSLYLSNSRENFSDVIGGDVIASLCNWAIKKSSWEAVEDLKGQFSNFSLEDKAVLDNRGIDRVAPSVKGCARRRRKASLWEELLWVRCGFIKGVVVTAGQCAQEEEGCCCVGLKRGVG